MTAKKVGKHCDRTTCRDTMGPYGVCDCRCNVCVTIKRSSLGLAHTFLEQGVSRRTSDSRPEAK